MIKIKEALKNLGLNEKQTIVYLNLLQLGNTTAYKIAQKSGLKRPTVYVVMEELRQKGLVLKIPYPKKQIYSAKSPEELIIESESKISAIRNMLPELMALVKNDNKPSVIYFEGIDGIKEILNFGLNKLENSELVGFNAHADGADERMASIFDEYNNKLKRKNIKIRGIVPEHSSLKQYREEDERFNRKMKIVTFDKYSSNVSIDIGSDFVKILMFSTLQGVVIEDKNLALAMKQIFEMQWDSI